MKAKSEKLSEKSILQLEARIPEYADQAVKLAYAKALTSGSKVLKAVDGKLVESSPDGSTRLIRSLPAPTLVPLGSKRIRRITR
jgi:hypothetical protein